MLKKSLTCVALLSPLVSHAYCFEEAGARYGVDPKMLKAIAKVESNMDSTVISKPNSNGTRDIGLMQINEVHLPLLAKFGITKETLLKDACVNVNVGAWVLSQGVKKNGNTWKAVGSYNSGNPVYQQIYAEKVSAAYYGKPIQMAQISSSRSNSAASRAIRIIEGTDY